MAHTSEQFDGTFMIIPADELQQRDVLLFGARPVANVIRYIESGRITALTVTGTETFGPSERLPVFRPGTESDTGCDACGTGPDESCDPVHCLGLALLDDTADEIFPEWTQHA